MVRIRNISRVEGEKSVVGRIYGTGKFLALSGTVQKEVRLRETEPQDEVQEVDSRDTVIYRKERICDFQRGSGWYTWRSSKILP